MTVSSAFVLLHLSALEFSVKCITDGSVYALENNEVGRLFPFFNFDLPFDISSLLMRNERCSQIHRHGSRLSPLCSFLVSCLVPLDVLLWLFY